VVAATAAVAAVAAAVTELQANFRLQIRFA
jgi:hypothetical protein